MHNFWSCLTSFPVFTHGSLSLEGELDSLQRVVLLHSGWGLGESDQVEALQTQWYFDSQS